MTNSFLTGPAEEGAWLSDGVMRAVQFSVLGLAALLLISLFHKGSRGRVVPVALVLCVLGTLVSSTPLNLTTQTVDDSVKAVLVQVHIVGGTAWVGGLLALVLLSTTRRRTGPDVARTWAVIWQRFSVLALLCVGGVLVSGLWLTWTHVGSVAQLWSTPYGRFLLVKMALVITMLTAGGYNQLSLMPRIARLRAAGEDASMAALAVRHFPRVALGETLLGIGVVGIVPFLSGSARGEAGSADAGPFDGRILLLGVLLVAMIAVSFWAPSRASAALARRPHTAGVVTTE